MAGNPKARVGSAVTPVTSGTLRAQIDATLNRLLGEAYDDGCRRADFTCRLQGCSKRLS